MITITITNDQSALTLDDQRLREAVRAVLEEAAVREANISVAVVDDATIGRLNEQFLRHEGPTDVLSFVLEQSAGSLEGEIVVSADTALRSAPEYGWRAEDELLLYVVHGALHLAGHDDAKAADRNRMQQRERAVLAHFGIERR